jgi:hypothetical protein
MVILNLLIITSFQDERLKVTTTLTWQCCSASVLETHAMKNAVHARNVPPKTNIIDISLY